jgi:hypothetical protein
VKKKKGKSIGHMFFKVFILTTDNFNMFLFEKSCYVWGGHLISMSLSVHIVSDYLACVNWSLSLLFSSSRSSGVSSRASTFYIFQNMHMHCYYSIYIYVDNCICIMHVETYKYIYLTTVSFFASFPFFLPD